MNIGSQMGGDRGSNNATVTSIKTARPLVEPEFTTNLKPREEMVDFSQRDTSEFSPAKAVEFSQKTALDNLLFGSKEVSKGQINRAYLEPYMQPGHHAEHDRSVAVKLKREIFLPIMDEAFNRYKGLDDVNQIVGTIKEKLKAAIGMHIDLSNHKVQRRMPIQQTRVQAERRYAMAG